MSDDKQFGQMQNMLQELIRIVGNTNSLVAETNKRVDELSRQMAANNERSIAFEKRVEERLEHIEGQLFRIQVLEKRQNKTSLRLEELETQFEIRQEKQ